MTQVLLARASFQNTPAQPVHLANDISIPLGAKDGAGASIGVEDERSLPVLQGENWRASFLKLLGAVEEEGKPPLEPEGRSAPVKVSKQNLIRLSMPGNTLSLFSKS